MPLHGEEGPSAFKVCRGRAAASTEVTRLNMATTEAAPTSNKTWKLTLYEMNRKPQEVLPNDVEVKVSPRSLHAELMCPICLDMLKNTMTTKECLHRFCQECITTALRSGNKECPTCRKKLVSRRSLRSDPTFDALINKIYPNRAEYEAHEERALAKLSKHHSTVALMNSIEEGMKMQALFRSHRSTAKRTIDSQMDADTPEIDNTPSETPNRNSPVSEASDTSRSTVNTPKQLKTEKMGASIVETPPSAAEVSTSAGESSGITQSEIELTLQANDSTEPADCRYIKTTDNATVEHLKKYLNTRSQLDTQDKESFEECRFHVFIRLPDHDDELAGEMTLRSVNIEMWKQNKPLELYYKVDKPMDA